MTTAAPVRPLGVLPLADGTYAVSSSDPTKAPYLVSPAGATFRCTCPAYTYCKDDPRTCKHCAAVRAHRDAAFAERRRTEPRWCATCLLNPVTDAFPVCAACMEEEQARVAAANERVLAAWGWE